ncbi:hypothetical protein [Hydrogenophaga aquatica]
MFESHFDQARGLAAWELQPPTRVVPVVAGDSAATLGVSHELLWMLEQGLSRQELPVTVMEGLHGLRPQDVRLGHRAVLSRWLGDVAQGSVVLLHAPLEVLAVLLADSQARPLVALRDEKHSLVWAYNAVKVLVQAAGLQPILVQPEEGSAARRERISEAFASTCRERLGVIPSLWMLGYDEQCSGVLRRADDACLLRVLDSALMIDDERARNHVDHNLEYRQSQADQSIGASDVHRQRHA